MRKTRRWLAWFLLIAGIVGILVSGCGKKENVSQDKVTLTFLCWGSTANMKIREDIVRAFEEKNPDIKIKTIHVPLNYDDKLQTMIAAGSPPDVFWLDPAQSMASYASQGALLDITKIADEDKQFQEQVEKYYKMPIESGMYQGVMYGLPWVFNPEALFYNENLFQESGLPVPSSDWIVEDLRTAAQKLTKDLNGDGKPEQYGFAGGEWYGFIWRFGGEIFDNDQAPTRSTINSEKAIAALKFVQELVYKDKVSPTPAATQALPAEEMFMTGRLAMLGAGGWVVPKFSEIKAFNWNSANMPKGEKQVVPAWSTVIVASNSTKYPQEAWEFIKFYAGQEAQQISLDGGLATVPVMDFGVEQKADPRTLGVFEAAKVGRMWPPLPNNVKIFNGIDSELDYLRMGQMSAEKVANKIAQNIDKVLKGQ